MPPADIALALLVGLALGTVLGLLGGGGGILAIPAFIHILGMSVDEASTTSLLVVAIGATAGLIPHAIAGRVEWRIGLIFGALGTVGAVVGARLAIVADDRLQMAGLIALIFLAASGMLRNADDSTVTRMRHRIPATPPATQAPAPAPAEGRGVPAPVSTGLPPQPAGASAAIESEAPPANASPARGVYSVQSDAAPGPGRDSAAFTAAPRPGRDSAASTAAQEPERDSAPSDTAPELEADSAPSNAPPRPGRDSAQSTAGPEPEPDPPADDASPGAAARWWSARTVLSASVVGLVTGFFGVGGGFVAVPALMWGVGLPVRRATATGLVVIVMNSVVALAARGSDYLAWPDAGLLGGAAIVGAILGALLSHRIASSTLKRLFGWLLLLIGAHEIWQLALLYQ